MELSSLAKKLGLTDSKLVIRKAAELRRLADVQFDSSIIGVGEIAKAVICLEIAATKLGVLFDRSSAVRLSGMSQGAYIRSYNSLHNGIGVKMRLDVRELAIQFGCVRIIPMVRDGLKSYKERFLASLPPSRRASADFTRPVFTAVAFYLCAKKHKLKVDKIKLIELCGTSESEFSSVSTSMKDLCHDVFGIAKEKKDPREVTSNRELLDVLPSKRKAEDGGYVSDDGAELPYYKKCKQTQKRDYEKWKSSVLESNKQNKTEVLCKRTTQTSLSLNFLKKAPESQKLEAT
ncbi:origin of replication complex subunit 6 [Lotus japonicus]|uniref:origin of replication complex subunit 6 n=1 Tax=Lotus japonicus TaxID=34305 RepID=UPI00258E69D0|nr:origin of replication complex subunit 6 [Lotus japonicus]